MASASTSSIPKSFKYDVFLSFGGKDTRRNLVDHLYYALQLKSIYTYKDDERIEKGKRISDELIKAIEDSRFYIIVFSENYASSSWCLDELVKIMECQKTNEQTAYPVFYHVEPTEVRYQSGVVGEAFAKHEKEEAAGKWREALKEAADLAGWELKNTADGHEAKFIQKIVEEISLELRSINLSVDGKLIGIETRIKDVVSSLETGFDDVCMIGIKGMGGGGKTTLARAVFDQISIQFEGKSFVENVREVSKASLSGLKSLQKQVLSDVLNDQGITVSSVYDGKNMMKKMMCGRKVLVVLDDVDHIDQLEALAGEPNWFKPGSRIIITTRDEQVLVAHRVNLIHDVNLLSHKEAICLFSRYAFGREIPIQGYEELSRQVVRYAAGLPLTIRVLGSFLCGKNELEWIDALERLKTIPLKETLEKLELSYIGLEEDYKEIFLDVACILKGRRKDDAIRVLESCGFHARNGLRVLEQKSLITILGNYLGMHDHIEEMGRNIVRRLHPDEPNKHSRLWIDEEIKDILANDLGTEATRCIKLVTSDLNPEIVMKGLGNMKKLRFLEVDYESDDDCSRSDWKLDEVSQYFPNALRYLSWHNYPFWSLPKTFQANNRVELEMPYSSIVQLWEGEERERKVPNKLRILDLSHSSLRTLDLGLTPNLETLSLAGCQALVELHMPVGCLKLRSVDLYCSKLRTFDLGLTPNLEKLRLGGFYDLEKLHMPPGCLKLISFDLSHSKLRTLDLGLTPNLETLRLRACDDLVELHMPVGCLKLISLDRNYSNLKTLDFGLTPNLETLSLGEFYDLVELHMPVGCLKLRSLDLRRSKLRTLDLGPTPNLEKLNLALCHDLVELHMPVGCLKLISLNLSHSKLRTLDLGLTPNLEKLSLTGYDLVELHMPIGFLKLRFLDLSHSKLRTLDLGRTPNIEKLSLAGCHDLVELHMPVGCLKLRFLDLSHSKLRTLDLGPTPNLETLSLAVCHDLVELYMPVGCLKLNSLKISHSKLRTLDLGLTPNLEMLILQDCDDLVELHMSVGCLKLRSLYLSHSKLKTYDLGLTPNLDTLSLAQCHDLVELHMPVGYLKLRSLELTYSKLRTFDLGPTPNLETLRLGACEDLVELHVPVECLRSLNLSHSKLRTLDLGLTPNLETLSLVECLDLEELYMPIGCLKLISLEISHSKLRTVDLGLTPNLQWFDLKKCYDLVELHMPVGCLKLISLDLSHSKLKTLDLGLTPNLETLSLGECDDLVELHMPLGCLKLISLNLSHSKLRTFDLGLTPNLERLDLEKCYDLVELHARIGCLKLKFLYLSRSKLRTLDLGLIPNLERLDLKECYNLVELHAPVGCLKKLVYLDLSGCLRFKSFLFNKRFVSLEVGSSSELHLIVESLDICPLHSDNNLPKFRFTCFYKEHLPSSIGNLEKLISVGLCACTNLKSFSRSICGLQRLRKLTLNGSIPEAPKDLHQLECLEELILSSTEIKHLPDSICMLKHLKSLELKSCWLLEKLPEDLGRLECLEKLILTECIFLRDIPDSICKMKRLKYFHLPYCILVEKLPEELGRLECLKELNIVGTGIRHLPQSIFLLKGLRIVGFRWLLQSCGFTSEIQTSECVTFCYI